MNTLTGIGRTCPNARRRGFTLTEVLVASSVGTLIAGFAMLLLVASAKEARRGVADATVEEAAGLLQNKIIGYLRSMSANEGVVYSGPVEGTGGGILGYTSIIVAQGPAPEYPREQIIFSAPSGRVLYDPNRARANDEIVLGQNKVGVVIRQVCFTPSLKEDGTTDNALINVLIKLDDNNSAGRLAAANPANIWRTFAVRMRNN